MLFHEDFETFIPERVLNKFLGPRGATRAYKNRSCHTREYDNRYCFFFNLGELQNEVEIVHDEEFRSIDIKSIWGNLLIHREVFPKDCVWKSMRIHHYNEHVMVAIPKQRSLLKCNRCEDEPCKIL